MNILDTLFMLLAFALVISIVIVGSVFQFGVRPLARGLKRLKLRLKFIRANLAVLVH